MSARAWSAPATYHIGDRREFHGILLVCCVAHVATVGHKHPWAPGTAWTVERRASMWAPSGNVEARRLRSVAEKWSGEQRKLALLAAGPERPYPAQEAC